MPKSKLSESVFQPVALPFPPKTDAAAQRLYYHIRTLAFLLDALTSVVKLQLPKMPFDIGLDAIVGAAIPIVGDVATSFVGLYIVFLCAQFSLPLLVIFKMLLNVLIDAVVGIVPFVGDAMDAAFKANIRNLLLLEEHLISNGPPAGQQSGEHLVVRIAPNDAFWPETTYDQESMNARASRGSWFGSFRNLDSNNSAWKRGGVRKKDMSQWPKVLPKKAAVVAQEAVSSASARLQEHMNK